MSQPNTDLSLIIDTVRLPENESIQQFFARIQHHSWSMLLDSANSAAGRYHIMLWEPETLITAQQEKVWVDYPAQQSRTQSSLAPLACVDALVQQRFAGLGQTCKQHSWYQQLPFVVGAAGLCGYDLGRYYEQLPDLREHSYHCPDMAVGIFTQSVIMDTHTDTIYHCRLSHHAPLHQQPLWQQPAAPANRFALTSQWQSNLSQDGYTQALAQVHRYIVAGDCYQINMAQRFEAGYQGCEWQAYQALTQANNTPFSAFIRLPDSCVLSISPERFISVNNNKVQTKPIKGTRPRYPDKTRDAQSAAELQNAEKDRAENLMIVDLLRNDLSKHCQPHTVKVPHLFALESYEAVHHLVSTVEGELNPDASPLDLLAGAFPGGSITGAPKIRAMEIIEQLEPHRRNIYCGSIMYYGIKQDMDSSITIRTLLAENHRLYCWAGGGIVLDSQADAEYQETLDKVSRILPALEQMQ